MNEGIETAPKLYGANDNEVWRDFRLDEWIHFKSPNDLLAFLEMVGIDGHDCEYFHNHHPEDYRSHDGFGEEPHDRPPVIDFPRARLFVHPKSESRQYRYINNVDADGKWSGLLIGKEGGRQVQHAGARHVSNGYEVVFRCDDATEFIATIDKNLQQNFGVALSGCDFARKLPLKTDWVFEEEDHVLVYADEISEQPISISTAPDWSVWREGN